MNPFTFIGLAALLALTGSTCLAAPAGAHPTGTAPDLLPALREYLKIDTSNPPGNEMAAARFLARIFDGAGIPHEIIDLGGGRANLVARLAGNGTGRALLLFNHMDVVQAERATWTVDPFAAAEKDGFLYARGALDMKTTGLLQALTLVRLKREGELLPRDVLFLATSDEEVDSIGMTRMIDKRPDFFLGIELALTEGETIDVEKGIVRSWPVDISEKAVLWLRLTAKGRGGHGSVPFREGNAVDALVGALERIRLHETALKVIPAVQKYFASLKDSYPGLDAARLANLEASLADPAFRKAFLAAPERAALVRNTISITVLKGGPQTNVIPSTASAELDCRLLPGEDPSRVEDEIKRTIDDPSISIERLYPAPPATASPTDTALWRAIEAAARQYDPGVPVVPSLETGWTECSLLRPLGIGCYGFEPYALTREESNLMHGDDERISIENIRRGAEIYYAIVRRAAGAP